MKLHYQPPRRADIVPAAFRKLGRKRTILWQPLAGAACVVLLAAIGWIWWKQATKEPMMPANAAATVVRPTTPVRPTLPKPVTPPSPGPSDALRVQAALIRFRISPGPMDGLIGTQTRAAIAAFQKQQGLRVTGELDVQTRQRLGTNGEVLDFYTVTAADLAQLRPLSPTWLGKSSQDYLGYETLLELAAERSQSDEDLIWQLNSDLDWDNVALGTRIRLPQVSLPEPARRAAEVRISLGDRTLQVFDERGGLLAHFPCSIGHRVEKRPLGALYVTVLAMSPNYTFDPAVFPESAEGKSLGRKLILQPGPNNPVGTVWIGLDRPGYGIHGTPQPEKVGRTESHGCFRLANWNAEYLLKMAWVGLPVLIEER